MTVKDLIKELLEYNLDATVFVGDCLNNTPELSYGGKDACTKKDCEDVGIFIAGEYNQEMPS